MSVSVKLNWQGDKVLAQTRQAAAAGLLRGAEYLLEESNRTTPHDEGTLEASGETSVDESRLEAAVSYDKEYAARLHENPRYHFQGGRRGKWLELTFQERGKTAHEIVGKTIESQMR
jgi:hypothetical protein